MCTVIIYKNKKSLWPFIVSFNRDEFFSRKTLIPKRHWKKHSYILAGKDLEKGGTWFGINDHGLFICVSNRNKNKNKDVKKNNLISRGQLVISLLKEKNIIVAKNKILNDIKYENYNGFNLIISNYKNTFLYIHDCLSNKISERKILDGLSIITNDDYNNFKNKKINEYYQYFKKATVPNPETNDWNDWTKLMFKKTRYKNRNINQSVYFNQSNIYGTVSCSQVALSNDKKYIYRYSYKNPLKKNFKLIKNSARSSVV